MPRRWKVFLVVSSLALFADQATKVWARASLPSRGAVEFIPGLWDWRLSFNPGSAFSLFHGQAGARIFLTVIGILAVGAVLWMVKKARDDQRALTWSLALIVGGAVGNLIDRIRFGVVTDFAHWHYQGHDWPVFNVADVALVVGVGLMFLDMVQESRRKRNDVERVARPA